MLSPRTAVLGRGAAEEIRRGHPWVFRNAIRNTPALETGMEVSLISEASEPLGIGLWDAESPIAIRVWSSAPAPG